ncbi:MAG: nucleotidyl transferase AbiEii/AbiGii toxin family protein [Candidatus Moranbacteria bacterium]|nr:nucleotidyl transferase AbiEii/AbiGii toxin family protein [Candidatus Moranbacteria bacterium]
MLGKEEIDQKAAEFGLNPVDVEKDYVYGWLLNSIYSDSSLGDLLVLKGGNALRKGYLLGTRFSKDLDFSLEKGIQIDFLHEELDKVCSVVNAQTQVKFELDRTRVEPKNLPIANLDVLEARLYFKGFYGEETISLKTQLDITQFDKIYLPVQSRKILHPYSDAEACSGNIKCQKAEEIVASKLNSLLHRRKVCDLFDLLKSTMFTNDVLLDRSEVVKTFLKKTIYEATPDTPKQQLLSTPLEEFRPFWGSLVTPNASIIQFDDVVANFGVLISSFFDLVAPLSPQFVPAGAFGGSRRYGSSMMRYGSVPSFFSAGIRNIIINAGRTQKLIQLTYDNYTRLVEPYSMEYYVRKSDGVGLEYFWGYDTTGGKSGEQSIKRFICDKIQFAKETDRGFNPRFAVEF